MEYRTEERKRENTKVKEVTSVEFKDRVLSQSKCVVEVFKTDCDACHYNGTMYDIVS